VLLLQRIHHDNASDNTHDVISLSSRIGSIGSVSTSGALISDTKLSAFIFRNPARCNMTFLSGSAAISKFFFFLGLSVAGFAVFLHPMNPTAFVTEAFVSPHESVHVIYGQVQGIAFWISMLFIAAGVFGMLLAAIRRWRARHFFSQREVRQVHAGDGEENWMFL
jgi:hypothetical protein